ncbi:caspase family protein [Streptomyces sp. NPDC002785]|uniref:caspase, EACC1-associated type n=1 Tax=Streptomyces sp. NPDC002785 TaxID=3154543 RepID=UPI00331C0630
MAEGRRYRGLLIGNAVFPCDPNGLPALNGPRDDIAQLRQVLTDSQVGLFDSTDLETLPDHGIQDVREEVDELFTKAKRGDVVLLYYSGHGLLDERGTLYLCAKNTRSSALRSTALSAIEINNIVDSSAASSTVIILDCCYSGAFKGAAAEAPLSGRGRYVLSSSRSTQLTRAADSPGQPSPFTGQLVRALRTAQPGKAAEHLTVVEVYQQVHDWVTAGAVIAPQLRFTGEGDVAFARRPAQPLPAQPQKDMVTAVEAPEQAEDTTTTNQQLADENKKRAAAGGEGPALPHRALEPPLRAARSQAQPAALRMSRRRVLAALSFAGVAAGGGTLSWVLWPKGVQSRADSNKSTSADPSNSASADPSKPRFEVPSGKEKIDAVMQVPVPDGPQSYVPRDYWLFAGTDYLRVSISSTAQYPVDWVLKGTTKLGSWGDTIGTVEGFREGIDAVLRVPGKSNHYWVFSKDQYICIKVSAEGGYKDNLVSGPNAISDWGDAFYRFTSIDSVIPVPGNTNQVWVFSGNKYVLTKLKGSGEVGGTPQMHGSISAGWKGSIGSLEGFSTGIDAAIPLPGEPNQYWVFSGMQYMKIEILTDNNHTDSVLQYPRTLRTERT